MLRKLNLGCGYVQEPDDWVHVDKLDYGQEIIDDVLKGLKCDDNHFDFVLMNHTLQMFKYDELPIVLKEVRRVMKPGATLRILVPDFDKALEAYRTAQWDYFPISNELEVSISSKFSRYLFWHGDTRSAYNYESLRELLRKNGFFNIVESPFGECELDSRQEESLIMIGVK